MSEKQEDINEMDRIELAKLPNKTPFQHMLLGFDRQAKFILLITGVNKPVKFNIDGYFDAEELLLMSKELDRRNKELGFKRRGYQ